jgi:hypothetical protein
MTIQPQPVVIVSVLSMKRMVQGFAAVMFGNDRHACLGTGRNEAVIGAGVNVKFERYAAANETASIFQLFFHDQIEYGDR